MSFLEEELVDNVAKHILAFRRVLAMYSSSLHSTKIGKSNITSLILAFISSVTGTREPRLSYFRADWAERVTC